MYERRSFLVVEPDSDTRKWLQVVLRPFGHVLAVADATEALVLLRGESHIDVVTMELKLPDSSARKLLRRLRREFPESAVIIITQSRNLHAALRALRSGARSYLVKPFAVSELAKAVEDALANRQTVSA